MMQNGWLFHSRRRKRRGLPVTGDKTTKDGKKIQASGKASEMNSKDRTATVTAGKPVDVKKSHEAESFKTTATLDVRSDAALPEQGDSDDRLHPWTFHIILNSYNDD